MRNVLLIGRHDLRRATSNVMAIIVLFGLIVIPSLFTWFNVIASWNPFDNTRNLTVAVANSDDGYQSDLIPIRVNIGDQVLSALRANDQLNWVITTEDNAIDGTKSGDYYAAIVLPPSFSADMLTFYAQNGQRTQIEYYTNEKKNALAPKITEQGAGEVSNQINEAFTQTLSEAGLNIISGLSTYLEDPDTQAALTRMHAHVGEVTAQLRAGADTAKMFTALLASSKPLVAGGADLITSSGDALRDASAAAGSGVDAAKNIKTTLDSATSSLSSALTASADRYQDVADSLDEAYRAFDQQNASVVGATRAAAGRVQTQIDQYHRLRDSLVADVGPLVPSDAQAAFDGVIVRIDRAIDRQEALHDRLTAAAAGVSGDRGQAQAARKEIRGLITEAKTAIQDAGHAYTGNLKPKLDQLAGTLTSINTGVTSIARDLSGAADTLSTGSDSLLRTMSRAESATKSISKSLNSTANRFDELADALTAAMDTGDLSALTDMIGSDPQALAVALAEPVNLDRHPVFEVTSFGSAMAPLYTVLALWVGALLAAVSIRVDVPADALPGRRALTPAQMYAGRYGIFALIGFLQSTVVCTGLILFVQVEPAHPFLLLLAGWVMSFVFTLIIYTFVVAFGNAGKALAVLLLVIQISSSGGAYPLQVLPQWFQNISPFLPATHAVNAVRAAVAGVYHGDYWVSLGWLVLFVVPTLLLGFVLRRPLIGFNRNLLAALESTKLM